MFIKMKLIIISLFLATILAITGCEKEGPAEKAGKKIDDAVEETGDALEEAGDEVEEKTD